MATKITWNADADAKLFLGVLAQLKDASLSLDYDKLAAFMGPDVVRGAIVNRIKRLKRKAESESGGVTATSTATEDKNSDGDDHGDGLSGVSPKKRKVQAKPRGDGAGGKGRKVKVETTPDGGEDA